MFKSIVKKLLKNLELWLTKEDRDLAKEIIQGENVHCDDILIALGPGAGARKRMWPIDRYIELGAWLKNNYNAYILVIGGPGEENLGKKIEDELVQRVINTIGRTKIRSAAALLSHCHLFIGNDSSPMHLAAASGIPTLEISCHPSSGSVLHYNSPKRWSPYSVDNIVIQPEAISSECHDGCVSKEAHCILNITVEHVQDAVEKLYPLKRNNKNYYGA